MGLLKTFRDNTRLVASTLLLMSGTALFSAPAANAASENTTSTELVEKPKKPRSVSGRKTPVRTANGRKPSNTKPNGTRNFFTALFGQNKTGAVPRKDLRSKASKNAARHAGNIKSKKGYKQPKTKACPVGFGLQNVRRFNR